MAPALRFAASVALFSLLVSSVDAFGVRIRAFNSSGAELTGKWVSPGIDTTGLTGTYAAKTRIFLRTYRDDGGAISPSSCAFDSSLLALKKGASTTGAVVATAEQKFLNGYWEVPVDLGSTAAAGTYDADATIALLTCADPAGSTQSAAAVITGVVNVGYAVTLKVLKDGGSTNIGMPLDVSNAPMENSNYAPFNSFTTSIKLEISCSSCGIDADNSFKAGMLDVPEMFNEKGITYTYANSTDKIVITFNQFSLLPPGVYDVGLRPGVIVGNGFIMAGGARVRIVYGAVPLIYNAMTSPITPSFQRVTSNLTDTIFVTNATQLGISQIAAVADTVTLGASFRLSSLYEKLLPISAGNGAEDVIELLQDFAATAGTQTTTASRIGSNNFTFTARLSEGVYKLRRNASVDVSVSSAADVKRNIVIIIDRTAPVGSNATWTGSAQSVGGVGQVAIPASMFWDKVSNQTRQMTVISTRFIGSDGLGFYCPTPVPLNTAFCFATSIRGPSGNVLVEVTAADEAGNQAVAFLTIPISPALVPGIKVADKRGVFASTSFKTGGPASLTTPSKITFTVVVTFADPVNANTLALTVGGTAYSATYLATPLVGTGVNGHTAGSGASSANGRVVTFNVVVTANASISTHALNNLNLQFSVAAGAANRSADGVLNVAASDVVYAYIDTRPPAFTSGATHYTSTLAAVGVPFFSYIPYTTFDDSGYAGGSSPQDMKVTLGTTADVVGLTVTVGKMGRAYISGTAAALPTARVADNSGSNPNCDSTQNGVAISWVIFSLTVQDEAGNSATDTFCVQIYALAAGETTSLLLSRNTLTYAENDAASNLDQFAAWSYIVSAGVTGTVDKIYGYLESPDTNTGGTEALAITLSGGTVNAMTKDATFLGTLSATKSGITQAEAIAALRSVTYANTIPTLTPGFRTARVVIVKTVSGKDVVVGSSFKTIYVTNVNNAPALTIGASGSTYTLTDVAWTENSASSDPTGNGIPLIQASTEFFKLVDLDDTKMASATLTISTTADAGPTYGACDITRDSLYLPSAYLPVPMVYGQWNPTACTFTLKPITGASMLVADLRAALHAVVYRNSDRYDPANGITSNTDVLRKRNLNIIVTDLAADSKAAAASSSTAVTGLIVPTLVDDEPYMVWDKVYGAGGLAYSTNQTSNIYVYAPPNGAASHQKGSPVSFPVRKFVLDYTASASASLKIDLDLRKVSDRIFAGGAIRDYDSANGPVSAGTDVTITLFQSDGSTAYTGAGSGQNAAGLTVSSDLADVAPEISSFSAGVAYFTVVRSSSAVSTVQGQYAVKIKYGGAANAPTFLIWIDVRERMCIDSYATLVAAEVTASRSYRTAATKGIYDPNACLSNSTTVSNYFTIEVFSAITPNPALTAPPYGQYVMSPAKVSPTNSSRYTLSGDVAQQFVGRTASATFNFKDRNASIFATRHALIRAGATGDDAIRFLASERFANRGLVSFYFEKNSFSTTTGSFTLRYAPVGYATALTLPPLATGEILDANLMFELTPACMQFAFPVTVCMYVGDTPAGYTRSLKMASQKSCVDNTRGWLPWEPAAGVVFDAMTGLLCGNSSHFTVFASTLVPLTSVAAVSKAVSMGGSCPNECSGRGFCRSNGVCQCFPGNNGNDCSLRTCPVAESWDAGVGNGHELAECSERGACNTKTGQCACYPGFTGAACQRTACPNDCSGRGQCKLIKDLPNVQAAGYAKWEANRLTKCVCDAGYMGIDCSERVCPFGDDPETTCSTQRQVQQVTLDFGSFPASVANPAVFGLYDTDELSLTFRTPFGQNLSVSRITDTFDPATGAANFARALKALPGFAVSDVTVTGAITADKAKATYNVTFDGTSLAVALSGSVSARLTTTANTVPGNQALFICPTNRNGALGCMAAGCRPKFTQARVLDQPAAGITASKTALLWQPDAASGTNTVGKWAVTVVVTVQYRAETGVQSYSATSSLWETTAGDSISETPLPPINTRLRNSVKLVYGLEVDFDYSGVVLDGTYVFRWRLPSCSVSAVVPADKDLELAECSRRGVCDRAAGTCKCFPGYAGASCGMQTVVV